MKRIVIPYFPSGIRYSMPLFGTLGIYLWVIDYRWWTVILVSLAVTILTTNYITEIDPDKKVCTDFLSVMSIPFDQVEIKFNKIEKIVITKENHSRMLNSRSRSRQLDWSSFTGSLIFDGNGTMDILTETDKKILIKKLKDLVHSLNVPLEDHTTTQSFRVDVNQY